MSIPKLDLLLDQLKDDKSFLKLESSERESIINANIHAFTNNNRDADLDEAFKSGEIFNRNLRRSLGEGRKQADQIAINQELFLKLPENFQDLSKDDQLDNLNNLRDQTGDIALQDPINFDDIKFQLDLTIDQTERQIRGEDTGYAGDKFARIADGLVNSAISPFDTELARKINREVFPENPKYDENFISQLSFGLGDFAGQTAMFLAVATATTPIGGTASLFATNASRRFQDNYLQAQALGFDEDKSVQAGIASLPGSVIDSFGDAIVLGKFFPSNIAESTAKAIKGGANQAEKVSAFINGLNAAKKSGRLKSTIHSAITEGLTEAAGDYVGGYGGYLATGDEEFIPSVESLSTSFAIGGILGGAVGGIAPQKQKAFFKGIEEIAGPELEKLKEESRNKFLQEFESGNLEGARNVLKDFKDKTKQVENKENGIPKRSDVQEVPESGQQPVQENQPSNEQGQTPSSEVDQGQASSEIGQITNQLVKAIAGDTSVEAELDETLPQRKVFRDKFLNLNRRELTNTEDALKLFETALVKASQSSGLDPRVAYDNLSNLEIVSTDLQAQKAKDAGTPFIQLNKNADFDTLTEELTHVVRQSGILARAVGPELNSNLEREYGVQNGQWDTNQEERFVDEFVAYLRSGRARNNVLQDAFDRVKEVFRGIYENILIAINPKTAFDKRAVRRQNAYVSPAAIETITELFNIDVPGLEIAAEFITDTLKLKPADSAALQDLQQRIQQAQESALQREGIGDVARRQFEEQTEQERARLIGQAVDEEIAAWYREQAIELGVVPAQAQIDLVTQRLEAAGFIPPVDRTPDNRAQAVLEIERIIGESEQDYVNRVNKAREDAGLEPIDADFILNRARITQLPQVLEQEGFGAAGNIQFIEARNADFDRLATGQRGAPESAMLKLTMYYGGGVYPFVSEHIGDITHRMSEHFSDFQGQRSLVKDKVEKTLRILRQDYGFEREMLENEQASSSNRGIALKEFKETVREFGQRYANEHKKLPVFNRLQFAAREAAVALGEFRFNDTIRNLEVLEKSLNDDSYNSQAGQYFENFENLLLQEGFGAAGNIGDIGATPPQQVQQQPEAAQQQTRQSPVNFEGAKDAARATRFIRKNISNFENSEDKQLGRLLLYMGRALPNIVRNNFIVDQQDNLFNSLRNFHRSRSRKIEPTRRLETRNEIQEIASLKATYEHELSLDIIEKYSDKILDVNGDPVPFTGDPTNLNEVRAWAFFNDAAQQGHKGPLPASEEAIADLQEITNELVTEFPGGARDWFVQYESLEGKINNDFRLRDDLINLLDQTFAHLSGLTLDGISNKDVVANHMIADALLSIQVPSLSKIGDAAFREMAIQGAIDRKDTWKEKPFIAPITKFFSGNVETIDVLNARVSSYSETQRFFQNEVFGKFSVAVEKMMNEYNPLEERYSGLIQKLYSDLGSKEKNEQIREHIIASLALNVVQVEALKDYNDGIKNNFKNWRRSIENQRNGSKSDRELADNLEKVLDVLEEMILEESGADSLENAVNIYEDLKTVMPQFLSFDGKDGNARQEFLDGVRDLFSELRPGLKFVTEAFRGPFQDFIDYAPTSAVSLDPTSNSSREIDANMIGGDADARPFRSGHAQIAEVRRRVGIGGSFYDLNLDRVVPRQILGVLMETYTTPSRFELAKLYKIDSEFAKAVAGRPDGSVNAEFLVHLKNTMLQMTDNVMRRGGAIPESIKNINTVKGQLAKVHLGSVAKILTESVSPLSHYMIRRAFNKNYNAFENMSQAMNLIGRRYGEYKDFIKKNNNSLFKRAATSEVELDPRPLNQIRGKLPDFIKKLDKATDFLLLPLKLGDRFSSHLIFASEYIRLLKESGQATEDINSIDFDKPDFKLIDRANRFMEEFSGVSTRDRRSVFFSDRNLPISIARNLIASYMSHLSQLGQQFQRDVRGIAFLSMKGEFGLIEDKVRNAAGIMAQIAVFSAIRAGAVAGLSVLISNLLKDMFDDPEGKLAELQKNIDEADGENAKIIAEQEYTQARIVRDIINKFERRTQSPESLFKGIFRDEISGIHIVMGVGNSFVPRVLIMGQVDRAFKQAHNEALDQIVKDMKDEAKILRSEGKDNEARELLEKAENAADQEYIPFFFDFPTQSGIPGIYGSVIDTVIDPVKDVSGAAFGVSQLHISDMWLWLQAAGIGQSDFNRFIRQIQVVEEKKWKQEKEFLKREEKRQEEGVESFSPLPILNL